MGRRGTKPTPTKIAEKNGAFEKNPNRRNHLEPEVPSGWPAEPEHIKSDDVASASFHWVCRQMEGMGILSPVYRDVIVHYAAAESRLIEVRQALKEQGVTTINDKGCLVKNSLLATEATLLNLLRAYGSELGLTPSSKRTMQIEKKNTGQGLLR